MQLHFGLHTFGDITADATGARHTAAHVLRNVVEQAVLAESAGIDFFGVGEHHRADFSISAPEVVLAAIASRTRHIRIGSAVTVLSSDDPVRVFERFSTLNALSAGRAEIIAGRGSFIESFPLFGYDLADYETLFSEKLALLALLLSQRPVTWSGTTRAPLHEQDVFPALEAPLKTWVGVGGSPASVSRAAAYGFPLMLAIISGNARRFRPFADRYRVAMLQAGRNHAEIGLHSPGHIAESDEQARAELWPAYRRMRNTLGAERGWPPATYDDFEHEVEAGSLYCGSPETVARKIATTVETLGLSRFDLKYATGALPHEAMLRSIELYGKTVAPLVRELLAPAAAAHGT